MRIFISMDNIKSNLKQGKEREVEISGSKPPEQVSESKPPSKPIQSKNSEPSSVSDDDINKNKKSHKKSKKSERLYEEISIPEGLNASIEDDILIVKKDDKEIKRKLTALIDVKVEDSKIIISARRMRRTEKRLFGTFKAHVKNMIKGLIEGFVFKLKIANVHFPMNVSYDKASNSVVVKNFLGEKKDRRIKLVSDVDVKVDGENIEVSSYDIEKAGIAATQIEKGVRVRGKDRRVYQDGIFLVSRPGKEFL